MKKKRSLLNRLLYYINSIFAILLLVAYVIPYIKPESLKSFAGISLLTPLLILVNVIFLLYWIIGLNRTFLLSFIILAIGFPNLSRFYKVGGKKVLLVDDLKIMSYNVRMFNKYKWIKNDSIQQSINDLIENKSPDILCLQEYSKNKELEKEYPYHYIKYSKQGVHIGQAVFSKYPIIKKGSFELKKTANNIIYSDIKIDDDTIRVYNIHLQSLKINPKKENFGQKDATHLRKRVSAAFQKQQKQVELLLENQKNVSYKIVAVGDFNNTAYSWPYHQILKGKKDAYIEAGKGFDKTYDFAFPLRIDFILVDKSIEINHFKAYRDLYSDHFPIMARLEKESL